MPPNHRIPTLLACLLGLASPAMADRLRVTITGAVENSWITRGPFVGTRPNDHAIATFEVDSDLFAESALYPVRGYPIDRPTFRLTIGSRSAGMPLPSPPGHFGGLFHPSRP